MKYLLQLFAVLLISACSGTATFKPTETSRNFTNGLDSQVLLVVDVSHLSKAFQGGGVLPPMTLRQVSAFSDTSELLSGVSNFAALSSVESAKSIAVNLRNKLQKEGITLTAAIINSQTNRDSFAMAVANKGAAKQVMLINAESFPMIQRTQYGSPIGAPYWSGQVSWAIRLFDTDKTVSPDGKSVWTAKTEPSSFNPTNCTIDKVNVCADRFTDSLIGQIRQDGLLKRK